MRHSRVKREAVAPGANLRGLVAKYVKDHQPNARREKSFFEDMPSFELAASHAAFAMDGEGKRYSHQSRISKRPMETAYKLLLRERDRIHAMTTFDEMHAFLEDAFSKIHGLGKLYTYDTALRLGFFRRLEPVAVYLHAGTAEGARALGIQASGVVSVSTLPRELHVLPAHEIENFLCVFKPRAEG